MKIGYIKKLARQSLKGKWGFSVLLAVISFGLYNIIPLFFEVLMSGGFSNWVDHESPLTSALSYVISFLLYPITIGTYWVFLSMIREEAVSIEDIFKPLINSTLYLKSLGISILIGIYTIFWTLLFIIPGIIKSISYSQAYYIFKDHPEYSIKETITASRKMMDGYKWDYFLLQLSFIGWGILCIFTLGIGLLWLVPYVISSLAAFYNERSKEIEGDE